MTTKDEMVRRIERSWDVLAQTFGITQDEAFEQPGEDGGWSTKDHLAHVAAWEAKALAVIEGREPYEGLGRFLREERTVGDDVVTETYEHYDDHLPLIQQLLGSRR